MRIQPVMLNYKNQTKLNRQQMQFERKNSLARNYKCTGVFSADLAYASMFNQSIANDLKSMGLI